MRIHGPRIEESRKKKGISQQELARAIGTSQTNISRWERDGADDLKATHPRGLLKTLNVTEAYLRGESEDQHDNKAAPRVEIAGVPVESNSDQMVTIEKSLARAFDHDRHTLRDLDDVRAVLRETPYFPEDMDTDRAAAVWLDACARLRIAGQRVTGASLAVAMMALPAEHARLPVTTIPSAPTTSSPPAMESTGIKVARKR